MDTCHKPSFLPAGSLLIQRVIDEPLWGLAYGLAPIGAVLATHGMHGALKSDRARRRFDLMLYSSAMAAFAYWASLFGPVFLSDTLSGFGGAAESGPKLSDFYLAHILAEVTGAAAAYTASMHMLTAGARKVAVPNESRVLLSEAITTETSADQSLAQERDVIDAQPALYNDALAAYQERCVIKVAVAKKLLATKSAADSLMALKELRTVLHTNPIGGDYDV